MVSQQTRARWHRREIVVRREYYVTRGQQIFLPRGCHLFADLLAAANKYGQQIKYRSIHGRVSPSRGGYISKGLTSIAAIGAKYSPPGAANDPNNTNASWPANVQRNYDQLKAAGEKAAEVASKSVPADHPLSQGPVRGPLVPAGSKLKDMIKDINIKQRVEGATGGTNVAMNPTINVHAATDEQGRAIGRSVERAMQDPTKQLLAQLREARNQESRLGYT
jgi:hypothetical protein